MGRFFLIRTLKDFIYVFDYCVCMYVCIYFGRGVALCSIRPGKRNDSL